MSGFHHPPAPNDTVVGGGEREEMAVEMKRRLHQATLQPSAGAASWQLPRLMVWRSPAPTENRAPPLSLECPRMYVCMGGEVNARLTGTLTLSSKTAPVSLNLFTWITHQPEDTWQSGGVGGGSWFTALSRHPTATLPFRQVKVKVFLNDQKPPAASRTGCREFVSTRAKERETGLSQSRQRGLFLAATER